MQLKTIEKTIITKMNEWLDTITDGALRESVRVNLLVSGGSITSLFLGENVNDYDVYLKDMDVLKRLAVYYTKDFKDITIFDGREKEKLLKEIEKDENNIHKVAINTLKDNQIKLFFNGDVGFKNEIKEGEKYKPVYFSPNAISLSNDVQIVLRFTGSVEKIHSTFDFIHATNYFTFKEKLVTNKEALISILTKQLKYQGSHYPITSIIRLKKFLKRNWNINSGEIVKILWQVSELNLKDYDVLEEQLIGVDVAYFSSLITALRNIKKPENINSEYIFEIIDRIFNQSEEEI